MYSTTSCTIFLSATFDPKVRRGDFADCTALNKHSTRTGPTSKKTYFHSKKTFRVRHSKKTFASNSCARPCSSRVGWGRLACGLVAVQVGTVRVGWVVRVGAVRVGTAQEKSGSGPGGAQSGWGPKFRAYFSLSRPPFCFLFFQFPMSLVALRWSLRACIIENVFTTHIWALWTSCEAPAATKHLGNWRKRVGRGKKRDILDGPGWRCPGQECPGKGVHWGSWVAGPG